MAKSPRESDLEMMLSRHADKVDQLAKSIPSADTLAGIVQGILATVDAKINAAMQKDKAEDAAQLQAVMQMFQDAVGQLQEERKELSEARKDASEDRKAMMLLVSALAKPRKRSGEVVLPSGTVKMIISEMMDS